MQYRHLQNNFFLNKLFLFLSKPHTKQERNWTALIHQHFSTTCTAKSITVNYASKFHHLRSVETGAWFYRNMALNISDVPTLLQNTKKRKVLWESVLKAAQQQVHHFSSQHVSLSPNKFKVLRTQKKTTTIPKHLQENKSDKTNFHRFPQSKDVERLYNSQQRLV